MRVRARDGGVWRFGDDLSAALAGESLQASLVVSWLAPSQRGGGEAPAGFSVYATELKGARPSRRRESGEGT